jgi:HAD domain in Swiss Army Knife RNA repair proteins
MKVLFLDVDGVLNSIEWCKAGNGFGCPPRKRERCTKERLKWCPDMVRRLRMVIEQTGAHIVVSSSWRGYGAGAVRKWKAMFNVYGWRNAPVIGETPDLTSKQPGSGIYVAVKRGEEVAAWLNANQHVDRFVCVDDGDDFMPDQPLVLTDMETGLTEEAAMKCIALLS